MQMQIYFEQRELKNLLIPCKMPKQRSLVIISRDTENCYFSISALSDQDCKIIYLEVESKAKALEIIKKNKWNLQLNLY